MDGPTVFKSKGSKVFYRHITWRFLKAATGTTMKVMLPTFVVANTVLAVIPEFLFDWLGISLWKLFSHWIGFIILVIAFVQVHRKQPEELKSGVDGGKKAAEFESTLDWERFEKTRKLLSETMQEAKDEQYPGIDAANIQLANDALSKAQAFDEAAGRDDLKTSYRDMMVARHDLLVFFDASDRKSIGWSLAIGGFLVALPHLVHFISIPFRVATL